MKSKQKEDEFKLRIAGISLGNHKFSAVCDKEFFEISGITELQDGALHVDIEMEKNETMMNLFFHFKGNLIAPCDRCLDPVSFPMDFTEQLVVNFVSLVEEENQDDAVWMVNENEYELDVFHFVYETIRLALPIQIMHPDDEEGNSSCNSEILKQLEALTQKEEQEVDPRWSALKNIKLD